MFTPLVASICCYIFSMKGDLKTTLLLLSFLMHLILKVEPKNDNGTPVHGITGDNLTAEFTFPDLRINYQPNTPSLYKNDYKIKSCKQTGKYCSVRFVLSDVANSTVLLHIINITLEDEGIYHVMVPVDGKTPLIFSNKISLTVKPRNETTETTPISKTTATETSKLETKTVLIYINVSALICVCLTMGLLVWFYRTCPRKPAVHNHPAQSNSTTQKGDCGKAGTVTVSCVEYGELDFPNRNARNNREKTAEVTSKDPDSVEYAAIIFPQHKQTPGGQMRDKQRVLPITRKSTMNIPHFFH